MLIATIFLRNYYFSIFSQSVNSSNGSLLVFQRILRLNNVSSSSLNIKIEGDR